MRYLTAVLFLAACSGFPRAIYVSPHGLKCDVPPVYVYNTAAIQFCSYGKKGAPLICYYRDRFCSYRVRANQQCEWTIQSDTDIRCSLKQKQKKKPKRNRNVASL